MRVRVRVTAPATSWGARPDSESFRISRQICVTFGSDKDVNSSYLSHKSNNLTLTKTITTTTIALTLSRTQARSFADIRPFPLTERSSICRSFGQCRLEVTQSYK